MIQLSADIAVIAGGPAGLSAAVQAAEDGASVILIEKAATCGGAANMGMGPLGIGTHHQKRQMLDVSLEKCLRLFMEYTHYMVDARLVRRYFALSADTIEWLEEKGVEFEGAFRYFAKSEPTWHIVKTDRGIGARAASFMIRRLYERALELGVDVRLETKATKILKENGAVTGVRATGKDGEELEIRSRAVIVATGGAGANPDMIREETGLSWGEDLFNTQVPGLMGEGLRMAWEAGAARTKVRIEGAATVGNGDIANVSHSVHNVFQQPNLLVNLQGKRFMDENDMQNTTFLHNAVSRQKHAIAFSIIDTRIARYYIKNGVDAVSFVRNDPDVSDFIDSLENAIAQGSRSFFKADTLGELAEKTGIDRENLLATVEDYNAYCESWDEEFFKDRSLMRPIDKAPFYCAVIRPGGYGTVGGIRINENCEALDGEFEPVPGLYAAGADACNLYDDSYMFLLPGNSMGFAVNSGRIAGMSAAEYAAQS